MEPQLLEYNRDIIDRYTGQPSRLPAALRARLEQAFGGRPVQLYALADLDASLRLAEVWLALGPEHVATATRATNVPAGPPGDGWTIQVIRRADIQAVREVPGLKIGRAHV